MFDFIRRWWVWLISGMKYNKSDPIDDDDEVDDDIVAAVAASEAFIANKQLCDRVSRVS